MVIPPNMVIARIPMPRRVREALRDLGARKKGTPLLTASTPVRAVQPEANALKSKNTKARPWMVLPCTVRFAVGA